MKEILIVDDDAVLLKLISTILQNENYKCSEASNATRARQLLEKHPFDLILSDINLPGESGLDFVRFSLDRYPDTAVIMVSGIGDRKTAAEALSIGSYGYLIKPFGRTQLLIAMDNAFRRLNVEKERRNHIEKLDMLVREQTKELRENIQEMKHSEEQLKTVMAKYLKENNEKKQLMEAIPSILIGISREDRIIQWNLSAEKTLGLKAMDVMGKPFRQCGISWDWSRLEKGIFFCRKEKNQVRLDNLSFTRPDGSEGFLGITLAPMASDTTDDSQTIGFIFIAADITALKQARADLHKSEIRHRILFESSQDAILTMEPPDWNFTSCNQATLKLFNVKSKEDFTELHPWDVSPEYQPDGTSSRDSSLKQIHAAMIHGSAFYEHMHKKYGGDIFPATVLLTRMELTGKVLLQGTVRDITEQKSLELQLTQARKLEAVGQLAAGIAHEINTPIQYVGDNNQFMSEAFGHFMKLIQLYEQLAERTTSGQNCDDLIQTINTAIEDADFEYLKEEIPQAIEQTIEGVNRISEIVRSMKEFSHPGVKEKIAVDINRAIENTLTVSRNEWKYLAEIETDLDPSLPLILCFPGELNQVFLNIIINAAQAIAEKHDSPTTEKGIIRIITRVHNKHMEIRISDTGPGIPEAIQPRIFDPFFTTKEVGKGTGQGLAISRSIIVEKHQGKLDFKTDPRKGTTFIIQLPIHETVA